MDIRPLDPALDDAALDLWARTEHLAPAPRAELERLRAHDPGLVLAALGDDGTLAAVVQGSWDGRRGWISRLAVDPAHRGRGLGRALVHELERRLAARGCEQVNLLIYDDNLPARRFWARLGYALADEVVLGSRRLDDAGPGSC